jgi:hypothetical protein
MDENSEASAAQPRWPSLEEQLKESQIEPGSKLEELVTQNQDFSVLRPEELSDHIRVPLWLRVQFRTQHPDIVPAPGDPTGGYPLALRDLYKWMLDHQDLETESGTEAGDTDGH